MNYFDRLIVRFSDTFFFGAVVVVTLLLLSLFGCSTENPLCTDNYCVEGEMYPRSWLDSGESFDEISVDDTALLNAIVGTTPPPPTLPNTPTLSNIVAHVAAGGRACLEKTYTLDGIVVFKYQGTRSTFVTLETDNDDVSFFISSTDDLNAFADYDEGEAYTFTVLVRSIGRHLADDRKHQSIHTDLAEE